MLFSSFLLLLGTLLLLPVGPTAHGQFTGTVCIIPTNASSCPSSPATVAATVGTQLRVSIFVQNSDSITGFQIILRANHTIIKPAGVDLTGSGLPGPQTILAECLGGVLVIGSACNAVDTPDTLDFAVAAPPTLSTLAPTTGLLFTAIYNVTTTSAGTPMGYQTGCSNSSISGTTTCVTLEFGLMVDPETIETAVFTTNGVPDFSMSVIPSSLTIQQGKCASSTVSVDSVNGFNGTVKLSSIISPGGPTESFNPPMVPMPPFGSGTSTLTICTTASTPTGNYVDTITGTSGSITHSATVSISVTPVPPPPPDFTITMSPSSLTLSRGSTSFAKVTITPANGFNSSVSLTVTVSPIVKHGLTASVSSPVGPNSSSTLTVTALHNTPLGTYTVTVVATTGSLTHSAAVTVTVVR